MQGRLENEMNINKKIAKKLETMPSYVSEWHSLLHASKATATSRMDYINKILRFLSYVSDDTRHIKPEEITAMNVTEYYISIQTKETNSGDMVSTSDSYQQTVYCALNSFLEFMVSRNYIPYNYMKDIRKPRNKDLARINKSRVLLTESDFKSIMRMASMERNEFLRSRDKAILMIFMSTGMRHEALRSLNVSDIDFEDGTLVVIDKGNKTQIFNLNSKTIEALEGWLSHRKEHLSYPTDALFVSNKGERISYNGVTKIVKKYTEKALGKPLSPHKLRAGYCSILYKANPDIEFVRRSVGHSDVSTTQRYIVTDGNERKHAASIIEALL